MSKQEKKHKRWITFLEFLLVGVVFGLAEDLLAIAFATDAKITWEVVGIVFLVSIPFAIISELIVDHPKFWSFLKKK